MLTLAEHLAHFVNGRPEHIPLYRSRLVLDDFLDGILKHLVVRLELSQCFGDRNQHHVDLIPGVGVEIGVETGQGQEVTGAGVQCHDVQRACAMDAGVKALIFLGKESVLSKDGSLLVRIGQGIVNGLLGKNVARLFSVEGQEVAGGWAIFEITAQETLTDTAGFVTVHDESSPGGAVPQIRGHNLLDDGQDGVGFLVGEGIAGLAVHLQVREAKRPPLLGVSIGDDFRGDGFPAGLEGVDVSGVGHVQFLLFVFWHILPDMPAGKGGRIRQNKSTL